MKKTITIAIAALTVAGSVAAQGVVAPQPLPAQATFDKQMAEKQTVERARVSVESRITPGAPYSADAVTETVQVLSDGNRIARKTATRIYRDSEGRTRREQLTATGEVESISISDPVAGSMFVLNPTTHLAHRNGVIMAGTAGFAVAQGGSGMVTAARAPEGGVAVSSAEGANEAIRKRVVEVQAMTEGVAVAGVASGGRGGAVTAHTGAIAYPAEAVSLPRSVAPSGYAAAGNVTREDLGQQVVEGVVATGTRMTTTIPAGAVGNEQPIVVVSEQWFSPELKILVLTKHSDPRSGDTTYRLTNVAQSEPARSLFEVPADYTLKDAVIRRQAPMQPQD